MGCLCTATRNTRLSYTSQAILGSFDEDDLPEPAHYAQGVDVNTTTLADGWKDRLVGFSPAAANGATGLYLERHDLVPSKLVAVRPKDFEFVTALLDAGLVDVGVLHTAPNCCRSCR